MAAICVFQQLPGAEPLRWSKSLSRWFGKTRLNSSANDPTMMPGFALLVPTQGGEFFPPPPPPLPPAVPSNTAAAGRPGRMQKKKKRLWKTKTPRKPDNNDDDDDDDDGTQQPRPTKTPAEQVKSQQQATPKPMSPLFVVRVPSLWSAVADSIVASAGVPTVLTCGGKNAGKSTFGRYLVNRLLSERRCPVAFLETDVGQSEFTPPGLVSLNVLAPGSGALLGPSPTHLMPPILSFFVGDVTPKTRPNLYMDSVRALLDEYSRLAPQYEEFGGMPLVINTHGWVKGMGLDLMRAIASHAHPAHIVKFESRNPNRKFPTPVVSAMAAAPRVPTSLSLYSTTSSTPSSVQPPDQTVHIMSPFAEAFPQLSSKSRDGPPRPSAASLRTMRLNNYFIKDVLHTSDCGGGSTHEDGSDNDNDDDDNDDDDDGDDDNDVDDGDGEENEEDSDDDDSDDNGNDKSDGGDAKTDARSKGTAILSKKEAKKAKALAKADARREKALAKETAAAEKHKQLMADIYARSSSANADRLARALPVCVGWNNIWVNVVHCDVPPSEIIGALNGAIVALCVWPGKAPPANPYLAQTPLVGCVGLGIVRSIDVAAKKYYVLTPVPLDQLKSVNVFLRGNVQLPSEMMLSRNFSETPAYHVPPHLFISSIGSGAGTMQAGMGQKNIVKRRRLHPK
jgi:polynucleotide 5'-hydroxyl-kinase GRC3/NOL9